MKDKYIGSPVGSRDKFFDQYIILSKRFVISISVGGLLGIISICFSASPSLAATVYTYTGNNFSVIGNETLPAGSYTTDMKITGSFTLAESNSSKFPFGGHYSRELFLLRWTQHYYQ